MARSYRPLNYFQGLLFSFFKSLFNLINSHQSDIVAYFFHACLICYYINETDSIINLGF
jgi:hypothetical protein